MRKKAVSRARKVLIKLGTNTISTAEGRIDQEYLDALAGNVARLQKKGKRFIIVSSGARIAGLSTLGKWERKKDIHYKQALCAIGQVELMNAWKDAFARYDLHIAQLLLTKDDFNDEHRSLNIRNTLYTLLDEGVIPIVNENDSVCVEEIKIGDNDNLAALTAVLWSADLQVLFSDIDGLYDKNPKEHLDAQLIPEVHDLEALSKTISTGGVNKFGTGGMETKIQAARTLIANGIPMVLANGAYGRRLEELFTGEPFGTFFYA